MQRFRYMTIKICSEPVSLSSDTIPFAAFSSCIKRKPICYTLPIAPNINLAAALFLLHQTQSRLLHFASCTMRNPGCHSSLLYTEKPRRQQFPNIYKKILYNNGANNRSTDCIASIKIFRFLQNSCVISWDFAIVSSASSFSCITA